MLLLTFRDIESTDTLNQSSRSDPVFSVQVTVPTETGALQIDFRLKGIFDPDLKPNSRARA